MDNNYYDPSTRSEQFVIESNYVSGELFDYTDACPNE